MTTLDAGEINRLRALMGMIEIRVRGFRTAASAEELRDASYTDLPLTDLLNQALALLNKGRGLPEDLRKQARVLTSDLTELGILPPSLAWTRRYFWDLAYQNPVAGEHAGFISVALDYHFKACGFEHGLTDSRVQGFRDDLEKRHRAFWEIHPTKAWALPDDPDARTPTAPWDEGPAAFELARLLMRTFHADGLAVELFGAFRDYEPLLYLAAQSRYRDHYIHVLYNFLLGCRLLEGLLPRISENWRTYAGQSVAEDEVCLRTMRAWILAALLHDVGYPAQTLRELRERLQRLFFSHVPGLTLTDLSISSATYVEPLITTFVTLLASILRDDEFNVNLKQARNAARSERDPVCAATVGLFRDQLDDMDHGLASALFVYLTLNIDSHELGWRFDSRLEAKERFAVREQVRDAYEKTRRDVAEDIGVATLAIALHNLRTSTYTGLSVRFTEHPIAWLLMLVDDLQEWDRNATWDTSSQGIRSVFGLRVFPRPTDIRTLFSEKCQVRTLEGKCRDDETYFAFLRNRVRVFLGGVSGGDSEVRRVTSQMQDWLTRHVDLDRWSMRRLLAREIDDLGGVSSTMRAVLRATAQALTNDVITITFVGGDRDVPWSAEHNRTRAFRETLRRLFENNLSEGPAICVLHGYEEQEVTFLFAAEMEPAREVYVVDDGLCGYVEASKAVPRK